MEEVDKLVDLIDTLKMEIPLSVQSSLAKDGSMLCTDKYYRVTYQCSYIKVTIDLHTVYKDPSSDYNIITIFDKMKNDAEICTLKLGWAPFGRNDLNRASKLILRRVFTKI